MGTRPNLISFSVGVTLKLMQVGPALFLRGLPWAPSTAGLTPGVQIKKPVKSRWPLLPILSTSPLLSTPCSHHHHSLAQHRGKDQVIEGHHVLGGGNRKEDARNMHQKKPFQGSLIKAEEVSPEKGFWDCIFYTDDMETNWNKQN